jgi:arylsulfatase A-like enzyme
MDRIKFRRSGLTNTKGSSDQGWEELREETFARLGWIPANAKLTPRPDIVDSWESIPQNQRAFQSRLMEVNAGFLEHTDAQFGKIVDELEAEGIRDNTLTSTSVRTTAHLAKA